MKGIATENLSDSQFTVTFNKNVFDALILALFGTFLVWYAQYHWKRRKLYQMAALRDGPPNLPLIGNSLMFIGDNKEILKNLQHLCNDYESPGRAWFGQQLFFAVSEPKQLKILLNSPHSLKKGSMYKYMEVMVGNGLVTAPGEKLPRNITKCELHGRIFKKSTLPYSYTALTVGFPESPSQFSVPKWRRHRKIITPTFNQRILNGYVPLFVEQSNILLKQLEKELGKGIFDVYYYVSRCTLDIVCETSMGVTMNVQTTAADYFKWANIGMEIMYKRMFIIWYQFDFIFNWTSMAKEEKEAVGKMHAVTEAMVTEKKRAYQEKQKTMREQPEVQINEEARKRNSFLDHLIELSENGAHFSDESLRDEVNTIMNAGSETSASTMSFCFIMLGMFPEIQAKVYEEIMDVLGADRPVECKDLGKLQYLERVIKEAMRLFPIGPVAVRTVTNDIQLDNCTIPAGSSVIFGILAVHRNPKIWPEPLKFDPDRFLPKEFAKHHPYSFLPFSAGPRNCVGLKYAMMAMKVIAATVVRKYQLSTDYKSPEDIDLKADLTLKPVNGYKLSVELREVK